MAMLKIYNNDLTASWKTNPKCAMCSTVFSTLKINRSRPMILPCYHNVCETCVYNKYQQTYIKCGECGIKSFYVKAKPFRQTFELNYYLNGFMYYKEYMLDSDMNRTTNVSKIFTTIDNENYRGHECNECNREYTEHFCIQCSVPYCITCFKSLHKTGKAFQKHNLSLLERSNNIIFNNYKENKKCPLHKQILNKYCQTCKEIICGNCATGNHVNHLTTSLQIENKKYLLHINSLTETVKMARDTNRQAIRDSKFVEHKYDQYCEDAIDNVTSYFSKLHNILQLTESKMLMKIKENVMKSIGKVKQTQTTLQNTYKNLDELINSLQKIIDERPNYPLLDIIEKTNNILETIPCQVKFNNYQLSPFIILKSQNIENDLENCVDIKCEYTENMMNVNLLTYFGDVSQHLSDNSDNTENIETYDNSDTSPQNKLMKSLQLNEKPKKLIKKHKKNELLSVEQLNESLNIHKKKKPKSNTQIITTKRVHVSHIKSPHEFYVQSEKFRLSWDEFHNKCKIEGEISPTPDYIEIDEIYIVYSNKTWYRGKILKALKTMNMYLVFLIDYGISIQIAKQFIRQISDDLQNCPKEAIKCTLIDIKKKCNNFTDEANILMTDIISKNQLVEMVILKEDSSCIVDLITTDNFPTSISDALIFTDVVDKADINKNDKELNRNLSVYNQMKKKLIPPITTSFYKTILTDTVNNRILPLNIKNPQEFYVTKYDFKSDIEKISDNLNQTYYKNNNKIFLPRLNMPCAVCIKGKWCRARILQVETKLKCTIWLVDYGISEIVLWKQLRVLDENFLKINEYSFECSLIDIEPLQLNNYSWTSEAITEFKRCMRQSNLEIFVHNTKNFCHKVTLYIVKKTVDINVNALIVKYGFAISTGAESLCIENPKLNNQNNVLLLNQNLSKNEDNKTELVTEKINKLDIKSDNITTLSVNEKKTKNIIENDKFNQYRKKIRLTSIKSPGEFYIHLEKHLNSINKLQKDIQITQNKKLCDPECTIKHNWEINDNCLAYIKLCNNNDNNILQWYRAVITNIDHDNDKYTIFLRDNGEIIDNIGIDNIAPIDPILDRICNTTLKCHLACVHPTGGMENWSHSSTDQLRELVKKFDVISACIQGEIKNNSIPVILWGMTNEYSDALSPNIFKWININKILVNNGLAHLYEKFDKDKQDLSYLDKQFEETDKQMKELWLNVVDNISKVIEKQVPIVINNPENNILDETIRLDFSDPSDDLDNITSWLPAKKIEKTLFTAIPTYIDDNAIIYLHDACSECVLNKIKKIINEKIENYDKIYLSEKINWYIGQPCIARYHLDNLYYRGEIINIKSNNIIQVCFVDYGNIEDCNSNDLIKDLFLTKVPIQATKYQLDGIVPNTEDGKWSRDVLDIIHSIIVMKMCSIRISENSMNDLIKKCSIRCESDNIIDILIKNNYVIKESQVFDTLLKSDSNKILKKAISKNNTIRQFLSSSEDENLQENSDDENDILIRASASATKPNTNTNTENRKDTDYYKKLFEKKELENLYATIMSGKELSDEEIPDIDCTFQSSNWDKKNKLTSDEDDVAIKQFGNNDDVVLIDENENDDKDFASVSSFNPKDTSTTISRFDGLDNFTRYELPYSVKAFYGEISFIRDATTIYIHPLLIEHEKVCQDMNRKIQMYVKTASPILKILPTIPCLAVYNEDNLWYRAIIKSQHSNMEKVHVTYVDYLNSDTISTTKLRKCPQQLIKYPLRLMEVRLSGLKPNPRWRHSDIMRRLSAVLLKNRKIYIKVIKEGKIPEIQLLDSKSNRNLVLQDLINERLYLLENEK